MHGIGGAQFSLVHDVAGAGPDPEDEGAVLRDAVVRVLHGVEHRGERRGECDGNLGGVGCLDAQASRVDGAVLEFSGALVMGTHVTSTMQKGILLRTCSMGRILCSSLACSLLLPLLVLGYSVHHIMVGQYLLHIV
ncbi:Inorganic phosphate transporter 2-1 [Spatholobus suberectus]|nr:Inorganic phosphate transporter 2-1 [Spatholobus suberectus]